MTFEQLTVGKIIFDELTVSMI